MSADTTTPDRRSPLVVDTQDLGRRDGIGKELTTRVPAPEGFGDDVMGVRPGDPVDLDLRLDSVGEGVLVTGTATLPLVGVCARCLREVHDVAEVDVQELFLHPDRAVDDTEASRLVNDLVDLEPLLRDEVVVELPLQPLCRPDCAGLCPECGTDLNAEPTHAHAERLDARWAGLEGWSPS